MIPVITTQPIAKIVKSGASVTFSVVATGGSLSSTEYFMKPLYPTP